jgi:hypothetical protein
MMKVSQKVLAFSTRAGTANSRTTLAEEVADFHEKNRRPAASIQSHSGLPYREPSHQNCRLMRASETTWISAMQYFHLTLKIPIPSRHWFRFRINALLLLMLITAMVFSGWRLFHNGRHARLMQSLRESQSARDAALAEWKIVFGAWKQGEAPNVSEASARARYFERRAVVDANLERLVRYEQHHGKPR